VNRQARSLLLAILMPFASLHAGEMRTFGDPMPAGAAEPVSSALASATAAPGEARKFSGRITEVCQAKGCWVMLEDEGQAVRVMMQDHDVGIPKDVRGPAIVHGTLTVKELDPKMAQHLADDAGRKEPVATREYRISATSLVLQEG
jgi:hypothetical protein